jgi:YgiT-type zinc finger domain-containing protein
MRQRTIKYENLKQTILSGQQDSKGAERMKCGICKAETEERFITYTEDVNQAVVVIRHVPACVCIECGNVWYSGAVAAHLESIIDEKTQEFCFIRRVGK